MSGLGLTSLPPLHAVGNNLECVPAFPLAEFPNAAGCIGSKGDSALHLALNLGRKATSVTAGAFDAIANPAFLRAGGIATLRVKCGLIRRQAPALERELP